MFLLFYLALRNQSWNQATGKLMIWSVGFFTKHKWMTKVRNYWWCRTLNWKSSNLDWLYYVYPLIEFCFVIDFFLTTIDFKWFMYETFSTKTSTLFSKRSNFVTKLYFLMDISHYFLYTFVYWNWLLFIILKLDHHKNKDTA